MLKKEKNNVMLVDSMAQVFAKFMTIITLIAIIVLIAPAIVYFAGINQYLSPVITINYWHEHAALFWYSVKGLKLSGFNWIFAYMQYTDIESMLGIIILMLTPLISIIAAAFKAKKIYALLLGIAAIEFIVLLVIRI